MGRFTETIQGLMRKDMEGMGDLEDKQSYTDTHYAIAQKVGRRMVRSNPRCISAEMALDSDDYVQELAIKGWLALRQLRSLGSKNALLREAGLNRGRDLLRQGSRRLGIVVRNTYTCENSIGFVGGDYDVCKQMLARLPAEDQSVVWCLLMEGGSVTRAHLRWRELSPRNTGSRPTFHRKVQRIKDLLGAKR